MLKKKGYEELSKIGKRQARMNTIEDATDANDARWNFRRRSVWQSSAGVEPRERCAVTFANAC